MKTFFISIVVSTLFLGVLAFQTSASETEVFLENFEGELDRWDFEPGWGVVQDGENKVLQGTRHSFAKAYPGGEIVALVSRIKILRGTLHISFRTNYAPDGQTRYFLGLNRDGSYLQKEQKLTFNPLKSGPGISLGEWHQIKIAIEDKKIKVFLDNALLFLAEDKDLITRGSFSFETLEESLAHIDDIRAEIPIPERKEIKANDLFPRGEHKGDIILEGGDILALEDEKFIQFGNIYLKDRAKMIIRNSQLKISRYERLLNHWGIELSHNASLEIENSKLLPGQEALFVIRGFDRSQIRMRSSHTEVHLFEMFDRAKALVENSEIVGEIGGLISANGRAEIKIINSKIGAVYLYLPKDAVFEASDLSTGFFKDWDLQRDTKVSGINYNVILQNTELVPDRLGPGPYERGFPVFIDSSAKVKIKDSQLRKVVIELHDEKAEFSNFVVEKPTNFNYRDIDLHNVKVMGQWGIFPHGSSDVTVRDSEAFWAFIYDDSKLTLINTHVNEFDPRDFRGEIVFENSRWDTAAEIIGGRAQGFVMGGAGGSNNFSMEGSLEIGDIGGFSWQDSKIERFYEVIGKPNAELILTKDNQTIWSGIADEAGKAKFSIKFDDNNFDAFWFLKDNFGNKQEITFFSKTPIQMEKSIITKYIQKLRSLLPLPYRVGFVFLAIVSIGIFLFGIWPFDKLRPTLNLLKGWAQKISWWAR